MAKFLKDTNKILINNLTEAMNEKLKNPYFKFNDKSPTITDYYSISNIETTLDPNMGNEYEDIGENSPVKYDKIVDQVLYGLDKLEVNFNPSDNGFESDPIQGSAIILPGTIIPKKGDFFRIQYLKDPLLFKVTSCTTDTVANEANFYRITWIYERPDIDEIEKQIAENFVAISENSGTEYKSVLKKKDYDYIKRLDEILITLGEYYKTLFYSKRVNSFIFDFKTDKFYDPYCIEFIIRNGLISTPDDYMFIDHQCSLPKTFFIDYNKSIFNMIEKQDNKVDKYITCSQAEYIQDIYSIFSFRSEPYYKIIYSKYKSLYLDHIDFIDIDLLDRIKNNDPYDKYDDKYYRNIIIKYLNNRAIEKDEIEASMDIEFNPDIYIFYELIIIIFIIEKHIKTIYSNI